MRVCILYFHLLNLAIMRQCGVGSTRLLYTWWWKFIYSRKETYIFKQYPFHLPAKCNLLFPLRKTWKSHMLTLLFLPEPQTFHFRSRPKSVMQSPVMPSVSHEDGTKDALAEIRTTAPASLGFPSISHRGAELRAVGCLSLENFTPRKKGRGN